MKREIKVFFILGWLFVGIALVLFLHNIWDDQSAGKAAKSVANEIAEAILIVENSIKNEIPDYILNPEKEMQTKKIDDWDYVGILEIPSFDLKLPVMEELTMDGLKISPCRYSGSPYMDNLVIGAHNYRAHFGPIREIDPGEMICFTDMDGNQFTYEVVGVETLQPEQVEDMKESEWDLTLFTCSYGGQTRATIRCSKVD